MKKNNIGEVKAKEAADKYGCKVILPQFSEKSQQHKPSDFNDLKIYEGDKTVKAQLSPIHQQALDTELPLGFTLTESGLFFGENDKEWVCSFIEVLAYTRDEHNTNWGRLVRFRDLDNYVHTLAIPMDLMVGDCTALYGLLLSYGLRINTKRSVRNKLAEYIQNTRPQLRALCTSRIGWHGNYFMLPEGAVPPTDTIYLQTNNQYFYGFKTSGTLEEWKKNIAQPCRGNSRLIFAICCAFAPPICPLINEESGGFNLRGSSSIGKSTALRVAASVWGSPKYMQQWKATSNALETIAESHNHSLLCLDELGQIDGKEAAEIAYMLANGSGKNRLKVRGGLQKKPEWELLFLSTGEISISNKIDDAGKKATAGIFTRIVDIPADPCKGYGIFDTVNHFNSSNHLVHYLKEQVEKNYGVPIREYLRKFALNKKQLIETVEQAKQEFFAKYITASCDGQVQRVARRFVIIITAGYLAIECNILPYTKLEIFDSIGACFLAWLEERGTVGAYELDRAITQVRSFLQVHSSSRFSSIDSGHEIQDKIINQAGFKRKDSQGNYEFFIFPEIFRTEICHGLNPTLVCRELIKYNMLKADNDKKFTKLQRLPTGRARVYHLLSTILIESDDTIVSSRYEILEQDSLLSNVGVTGETRCDITIQT